MRGGLSELQNDYEREMALLASRVSMRATMNGTEFIYQSAKDVLKWYNISKREHLRELMTIGMLYGMPDKDFEAYKSENGFMEVTRQQLRAFMES